MSNQAVTLLLVLAVAACGGSTTTGANDDAGAGTGGSAGNGGSCAGKSPAGCNVNGCAADQVCSTTAGCASSSCFCSPDGWVCTHDCGGGVCVPASTTSCDAAAAAITKLTAIIGACTSVVRLDYSTLALTGYQIICGDYAATDEAAARVTAQADAGFGDAAELISGAQPSDAFVFYQPPTDFGGVGVVSVRTGLTVFGGSIPWMGQGAITWPKDWDPPGGLGQGCSTTIQKPPARGWDLDKGAQPLPDAEIAQALDVGWATALPAGLAPGAYIFDAIVLAYTPTVGGVDPTVAEYVVLVDSGWLE